MGTSHTPLHQFFNFSSLLSISYYVLKNHYAELNSHHFIGSWVSGMEPVYLDQVPALQNWICVT